MKNKKLLITGGTGSVKVTATVLDEQPRLSTETLYVVPPAKPVIVNSPLASVSNATAPPPIS